ncbi:MAG TPA: CDP-alcohol phosphatidyltransferase family protein, partial [Candidatus Krumholzibacteria bacterium]|nr:CDP-alcohol phosphatidyltransferase family protein [Candidatus Krumholzibacteria bacterium]
MQIALASAAAGMIAAGGLCGAPWGVPLALWTLAGGAGTVLLVLSGRRLFRDARGLPVASPGLANGLTLLRLVWTAPVCVLLDHGAYDGALGLYALLVLSDVLDGIVARARRETSVFGVVMDPLADVISTFAVFTVFMVDNLVPLWLYLLLASRYAMLLLGSAILSVAAGPVAYRATIPGKVVGVVQAAGAAALMWGARAGGLEPGPASAVFAVLGLGFASIVVSQGVIGWRHLR